MSALAAVVATLQQRRSWAAAVRSELFDKQVEVYEDAAQFRALHPGRRGGKSEGIPRWSLLDALRAGADDYVIIGAETQKKAKALHWYKLERAARRAGIPLVANKQEGTFRTPWGAVILFWGISDEGAVDLLRGFSVLAAYFDEVATYASLLKYLCNDVMHPMLSTTGGKLTLCGTPSLTRAGYWFEICVGSEKHNWSVHHWDMLQNKCFPKGTFATSRERAEHEMAKAAKRLGGIDNATYRREWRGEFVNDPGMLVYQYVPERNDVHCAAPKGYDRETWAHTVAVDFGMTNACAWTVLASAPHSKDVYALRSMKRVGLLTDQAAAITAEWCEEYKPDRLFGDAGGLGKPYVEEWNQRYTGLTKDGKTPKGTQYAMPPMRNAEKSEKRAGIEFVNAELCRPRIFLCQPACSPLSEELLVHAWADETKQKEKANSANHCCDTLLYGEKGHMAYLNEAPEPPRDPRRMEPGSEEYDDWQDEEFRRRTDREWWDA